jgi:hypothetical protein
LGTDGPPVINPDEQLGDGRYCSWDLLCPLATNIVIWEKNGDNILQFIRSAECFSVSKDNIDIIFGRYRNGVRKRAIRCMQSGHLNLSSWKLAKVMLKSTKEPVTLITIQVTASMKSEIYDVNIVMHTNGSYELAPASGCDCPAGQFFCSHMLAFFLFVYTLQKKKSDDTYVLHNYEACLSLFPDVSQLRNVLVACKYLN